MSDKGASILETHTRDGWIQLVAGVNVPLGADPPQDVVLVAHYAQFDEKGKLLQLTAERPECFDNRRNPGTATGSENVVGNRVGPEESPIPGDGQSA